MRERQNKRILQSRDVNSKLEPIDAEPELPPMTGPRTGAELTLTPAQWLERNATPKELATFRASVQARLDRVEATGMIELPSGLKIKGDSILATCSNCRRWAWTSPGHENDPCLSCNFRALKGGGMMRAASKAEVKSWYAKEEAKLAKFNADAPKRAKDLADFNKRRFEDVGKDER